MIYRARIPYRRWLRGTSDVPLGSTLGYSALGHLLIASGVPGPYLHGLSSLSQLPPAALPLIPRTLRTSYNTETALAFSISMANSDRGLSDSERQTQIRGLAREANYEVSFL